MYYKIFQNQNAEFEKEIDLSNYDNGVYSLSFEFSDQCGNPYTYPPKTEGENPKDTKFYFIIDRTAPELKKNPVIEIDSVDDTKLNLSWEATKDLKTTKVQVYVTA